MAAFYAVTNIFPQRMYPICKPEQQRETDLDNESIRVCLVSTSLHNESSRAYSFCTRRTARLDLRHRYPSQRLQGSAMRSLIIPRHPSLLH